MFRRVPVSTPFQVGAVNAYVAARTVVDPGPDSEESWSALVSALGEDGLQPGDVERVVITHPHPDHFGLAGRLRDRGARVVATSTTAEIVGDFEGNFEAERAYFTDVLERCGLGEDTADTVTNLPGAFLHYAPSVETDREVGDGDTMTVGDTAVTVEETMGHAASELSMRYDADGEHRAVVGDHVLPTITPNPVLQRPRPPGSDRPRVLPRYNESLDRLAEEPFDRLLPGHGEEITDPAGRIQEIRAAHEERTDNVEALVDGPTTPVEVMEGLFGELPATELFPGMSEAVGHLDVLAERDRVARREEGGMVVYERTQ
jgi:glyoxylase-like metal-dependent hydrolase (beta-lactamase superfamily II)